MLRIHPIRQPNGYFCGPASLAMVLSFFGMKKTQQELARICRTTKKNGTDAAALAAGARRLGLSATIKNGATLAEVRRWVMVKNMPVIVAWFFTSEGHYSVVTRIDKQRITLMDPYIGRRRTMPVKTFLSIWFDFRGSYMKTRDDLVLRRMIMFSPGEVDKTKKKG